MNTSQQELGSLGEALVISDVEHLFMYLLTICMSSLQKCPLKSSVFKLDCFVILSCISSLYSLDVNPLSDIK